MGAGGHSRQSLAVVVMAAAVVAGLGVAVLGSAGPSFSRPGSAPWLIGLELACGWLLVLSGLLPGTGAGGGARGRLLVAAGFAWFAAEAANPVGSPPIVFTAGLLLRGLWPALIAHAALLGLAAPVRDPVYRALIAAAYVVNVALLGIIPTLAFDPSAARCALCPVNLLAVWSDPGLVGAATRLGYLAEIGWISLTVAAIVVALRHASPAERRREGVIAGAVAVALSAMALDAAYSVSRGALSNDRVDLGLWVVQVVALIVVAIRLVGRWQRGRQTRQRVARIALDLAAAPEPGELASALGRVLGDPSLEVLYPLDDGRLVDAAGASAEVAFDRRSTAVLRGGRQVALLVHRADLADDPARMADAVDAARLALENERLLAQAQARMLELRSSRTEIVAAAASERRRLERDLHDGSQQRLLALAIDVAIAREHAATDGGLGAGGDAAARALETEVRAALADLRELAHGIVPRSLADDGLAAALEELAERSPIPLDLGAMPAARLAPAIEAAAYLVVHRSTSDPAVRRASVDAGIRDDRLVVELNLDVTQPLAASLLVELEDQCGALGGTIASLTIDSGRTRLRSEVPCAS